jgi:hypothetical protein
MSFILFLISLAAIEYIFGRSHPRAPQKTKNKRDIAVTDTSPASLVSLARAVGHSESNLTLSTPEPAASAPKGRVDGV